MTETAMHTFRSWAIQTLYVYTFEYTWRNLIICLLRSWAGRSSRGVLARWFLNNLWGTLQVYKFKFGRPNRIILNLISGRRYLHTTPRIAHCGRWEDVRNQPRGRKPKENLSNRIICGIYQNSISIVYGCDRLMRSIFDYLNIYGVLRGAIVLRCDLLDC